MILLLWHNRLTCGYHAIVVCATWLKRSHWFANILAQNPLSVSRLFYYLQKRQGQRLNYTTCTAINVNVH